MSGPPASFVQDCLREIGRQRGAEDPEFAHAVTLRLEQGGREYGGSYKSRTLISFLDEMREEGADITGWAIPFIEVVYDHQRDGRLSDEDAQFLRMKAVAWASVAQYLWRDMTETRDWLDDPIERAVRNL